MRLVSAFVVLVSALYLVTAQDDGKYRPPSTTSTVRPFITRPYRPYRPYDPLNQYRYLNEGRYQGRNDGRYVGLNDGRYYGGNDGRYIPGNDGKYTHRDGKYQHVGDGDRGKYKHVEGPSGSNASNQGPSGSGTDANGSGSGAVTASPPVTPAPQPIFIPTTPVPALARKVQLNVAPRLGDTDGWKIIRLENQVRRDGYNYVFETANGINAEESGRIENDGKGSEGLRSQGFYQYVGDDGQVYRVDYVADTNGFVPQGDHIPKVPPAIEKLLQYLASQPK
ncbi:larval cuticle protein LCP-30-like [Malaya genurostris]|uniref:larval cuticle protein LCP-30-like n=1 Tax=Malaya genurostris TaxID=325434 RepID=UPI0026F3AB7D|nr:larval cuticle protein LCP-30-like [Malaya genurostris]